MNWYLNVLCKYAEFDGRARRREYWGFTVVNCVVILLLAVPESENGAGLRQPPSASVEGRGGVGWPLKAAA